MIAPASTTDATPPITEPTKTKGIKRANEDRYNSLPARTYRKWLITSLEVIFDCEVMIDHHDHYTPIKIPGIMPAANNAAIEISVELASTIIMILGGIIPPIVELTPVTAAENAAG